MIIGISGRIGSGKDVMAKVLADERGYTIIRFSDALKQEVADRLQRTLYAYASDRYPLEWDRLNEEARSQLVWELLTLRRDNVTRALLQEYGTEIRRVDDPNYWVKRWHETVGAAGENVVAPDMRFENEAVAVRSRGGLLVRIERPGAVHSSHESEHGLDKWGEWDARLMNDTSQEVFEERVRWWAQVNLK